MGSSLSKRDKKSRIDKKSGQKDNRQKAKNRHGEGQNGGENKDVIDLIYEQVKDREGNIIILEEKQKLRNQILV